jgi:hypothetical protein
MTQLKLCFQFSDPQNSMQLVINACNVEPDETGKAIYTANIELPNTIVMEISGKGKNDTIIDAQGNILKDKCIVLEEVKVNGISPHINYLKKWPRIIVGGKGSNKIIYSNYFGFNGTVELKLEGDNVFQWLLRTNKFRDNNWNTN